ADKFSPQPWLGMADTQYEAWKASGFKVDNERWRAVPVALAEAVTPPRNAQAWAPHLRRAAFSRGLIRRMGSQLAPAELLRLRGDVVHATRTAMLLYPTSAILHAELADASAEIGMIPDAVREGREALRLDALMARMNHPDKLLPEPVRAHL